MNEWMNGDYYLESPCCLRIDAMRSIGTARRTKCGKEIRGNGAMENTYCLKKCTQHCQTEMPEQQPCLLRKKIVDLEHHELRISGHNWRVCTNVWINTKLPQIRIQMSQRLPNTQVYMRWPMLETSRNGKAEASLDTTSQRSQRSPS